MKGCQPSLKSCKIRNTQWSLDREKVWILSAWYRRAMPDQEGSVPPAHILARLTALLPAPLSLARLLPTGVSALKSVLGSTAQKHSPDTAAPAFPYHEAQPFTTAQLGLHLHLAALGTWTRCRQPQAVLPGADPPARMTMRFQEGSDVSSKAPCVVLSLTCPSGCLPCCMSRHGVCPPVLVNLSMECGAGQEPCLVWLVCEHHPRCVQALAQHTGVPERMSFAIPSKG